MARASLQPASGEQEAEDEDDGLVVDVGCEAAMAEVPGATVAANDEAKAASVPIATSVFMLVERCSAARQAAV